MTTIADTIKKAMSTHWVDTPYAHGPVEAMAWHLEKFFRENYGVYAEGLRLEEIEDEWVEYFKAFKRGEGCSNSTINKYLSCLSVLFDVAGITKPTIKRLPEKRVEKWWMPPDQLEDLLKHLRSRESGGNRHFADFLEVLAKQGLRVKEALGLKTRHLSQDLRHLKVPGTKTGGAEATIPIFGDCIEVFERLKRQADQRGFLKDDLFVMDYEEVQTRWNKERVRLGLTDIPTATLKAFRRTFAAYATQAGMPTAVLQAVLRHEDIKTTQGYLRLTGDPMMAEAGKYMGKPKVLDGGIDGPYNEPYADTIEEAEEARADQIEMLTVALEAYTRTGATPEEVAAFTKAMLGVNS